MIAEQAKRLNHIAEEFAACLSTLEEEAFLQPIDEWSPRDILAHLIGWNRNTIQGCEKIRNGETPFYFDDPGEDFSRVNALLVRQYASQDKGVLLDELEASAQELMRYLFSLDLADWDRDYGITYGGHSITIRNTVEALIDDYANHRKKIEDWAGHRAMTRPPTDS